MSTKQEIRKMIRLRKQQHTADESSVIIARLKANPRFSQAQTLLLYSALQDEVPTQSLLDELVAQGKTVLLPRVVSDTDMELRQYTGLQDLQVGAFGILEPTGKLFTDYEKIDVAVVPGMAFDKEGHRLGRGKGYYDRFLRLLPKTYKIGICFSWQLVDNVPTDEHDILMDQIMTVNIQ
jgi:5-formyltetrahydrofolate cyclo-ligase